MVSYAIVPNRETLAEGTQIAETSVTRWLHCGFLY